MVRLHKACREKQAREQALWSGKLPISKCITRRLYCLYSAGGQHRACGITRWGSMTAGAGLGPVNTKVVDKQISYVQEKGLGWGHHRACGISRQGGNRSRRERRSCDRHVA
jgi:hypothetical protein